MIVYLLRCHYRSYRFAGDDFFEVTFHVHVEDVDGEVVLLGHHGGGHVHNLEAAADYFVVGDGVELGGRWVLLGIGGVDTVNAGALEHHVGLHLDAAQSAAGVGGEEGAASTARHDSHLALIHGVDGAPLAVVLAYRRHGDGGEHLSWLTFGLKCRRQRQ